MMEVLVPFHRPLVPPPWWAEEDSPLDTDLLQMRKESCLEQLGQLLKRGQLYLTPSCTASLEAIALAMDVQVGDEIIIPSFTYVTTASAFALRGARIVFADIRPETMNIDPEEVEALITTRTRAVVAMHYGGVACDMDALIRLCREHDILLIEDAAHTIGASYRGKALGTLGDAGVLSFHQTKNIQCGEGGLLIDSCQRWSRPLPYVLHKGTDKRDFEEGLVEAYQWQDLGSSFTLSSVSAAMLDSALRSLPAATNVRKERWYRYHELLEGVHPDLEIPKREIQREANGHIFWVKCKDEDQRGELILFLKEEGIQAYFHYGALHESPGGQKYGKDPRGCPIAARESRRLLRLPIYESLNEKEQDHVVNKIKAFYAR